MSFSNVWTILKLDLKSRFGLTKSDDKKKSIVGYAVNFLFVALVYAILVVGVKYVTEMFLKQENKQIEGFIFDSHFCYLVIVSAFTILLQLVVCTSTLVKALYYSGDNEMLLRFPVSGEEIFFAKAAYVLINNYVVSAAVMLPIYISYGVVTGQHFGFYVLTLLVVLFSSLLPFNVANIIAIPVMRIVNAVRNKFGLILAVLIALVVVMFGSYMKVLKEILLFMEDQNVSLFSDEMMKAIAKYCKFAYPFRWYANLLVNFHVGTSILACVLITAGTAALAYLVVKKFYFRTILSGIENQKSCLEKKFAKNKVLSPFLTLLKLQFCNIFRSINYSFQYLCMAIAAPFMVYFLNDIASVMAVDEMGSKIIPGLTLFVITIFTTIIVSFASTAVSREGNNFYQTKTIPIKYSSQIAIKCLLYGGIAFLSTLVSCIVVFAAYKGKGLIDGTDFWCVLAISEMVVVLLTAISIRVDTRKPTFNVGGDGDLVAANKNMGFSLVVGLFLSCLYGVGSMVLSYIPISVNGVVLVNGIRSVYWWLMGITGVLTIASVVLLFAGLEKRYMKIVP